MSYSNNVLPAIPRTQALTSTTYRAPPLDGSLVYPQLLDFHSEHSANHRFFVYAEEDGTMKTLTWGHTIPAILRSALLARELLGWQPNAGTEKAPVIAILSASGERLYARIHGGKRSQTYADAIPYATTLMGIMRAGYVPFPISTRNSPAAVAHLLEKTDAKHLIIGVDSAMQSLAAESLETLKSQNPSGRVPTTSQMPVFSELYGEQLAPVKVEDVPYEQPSLQMPAFFLHSSGNVASLCGQCTQP